MKLKFLRLLSLIAVMFSMCNVSVFAGDSYYSKVTAKAVGNGKVYVSHGSASDSPAYDVESSATSGKQSSQEHTYYLYAQADEGNVFMGWYKDEECKGEIVSKEAQAIVPVNTASKDSGNPDSFTYFAKFVDANAPMLVYSETHAYANLTDGTYKNETLTAENVTETITYESSNENVATVAADGTVTIKGKGSCLITAKSGESEGFYTLTIIDDISAGVTQIGNGDFEDWRGVNDDNHAPDNWNSFETNEGSFASMARARQIQMAEGGRPGSNGLYCADIWSRDVMLGIIAQGNLTTGCINAGATTATDKGNYNYSKTSDSSKSETLSKIPTAIRFWAKFNPGAENASYPNAHMEAVVHDNCDYITYSDPSFETAEEKSHAIAKALHDFPATNGEWKEFTIPFEKTCNAANGQLYIIVNFSTNAIPGQGQLGDHLYIDDVELLYETEYDEALIEMTDAKYATFCAPFDVNVPHGMTAYTVQGVKSDNILDMEAVEGIIPANTPVVLAGSDAVNLTAYGVATPTTAEAGLLTGVYEDTAAPTGSYVLQNANGVVGMYQVTDGQQPTVKANQAYLTVPGSDVEMYKFKEEGATSIRIVENGGVTGGNAIYNLAGQRINQMQKGLNIVRGKKILR